MPKLLTHPSRLVRVCASFALVLTTYWAYAVAAVPLIEPEAKLRENPGGSPRQSPQSSPRRYADIDILFGPNDWERRDPVVLENQRGKLLIGNYKNNEVDGSVTISPCTIIMMPEGEFASEQERIRQAVVLQARDKAILRFDEPFDIRRGGIGKLVSGTLQGPIIIRSNHKQPGPQDDLLIETRDVQLTEDAVSTDHAVRFRFGSNHGSGRQMRIDLVPAAEKAAGARGPKIDGLRAFTLYRDVRLHLVPDENQLKSAKQNTAGMASLTTGGKWKPLPIEVSCQGPFRFDLPGQLATFENHVDVLQVQPDGPSDQLSGELLAIRFAPKETPPGQNPPAANAPPDQTKLEPRRLEMKGNPVVIRSPLNDVNARGQRLEYDLPTRRISLEGDPEVVVTRGTDEIRAKELHYQPGESGRLGKFLAVGPGWLRGQMRERPQPVEAQWAKQLWIRPDPDSPHLDVVSLEGAAEARVPGMGGLKAEEMFCWLQRVPVAEQPAPGRPPEKKFELSPDRLLARGGVQIDAPQLIGSTEQLETWFEHRTPPAVASGPITPATNTPAPAGPAPAPAPPSGLASFAAKSRGASPQRFDVTGKLVRAKLVMTGREADLSELVIDGQARFAEIPSTERPQPPMLVEGDVLHVVQRDPQQATVRVTGRAHVEAGGLGLRGQEINLNRGTNQLWIDGAGQMTIQADRDLQGRPLERPQPLEVNWQGRMVFNGLTANFERSVDARSQQQHLRTDLLTITLSKKIDFAQAKLADRPELAEVVCRGGVLLDSRTLDEQGLASIEHMEVLDLSINRLTGAVIAHAFPDRPALIAQVRRGDNRAGLAIPGNAKDSSDQDGEKLSYLQVKFHRTLEGNLNNREMTFGDRVRTIYGPVPAWEATLSEETLGERGILLTCDRMKVLEMPTAMANERSTELEAIGNTSVEDGGETFLATAHIIRYSSDKGKLVLEGDGRRDVTFVQRPLNGGERKGSARKVEYTPEKRYLKLHGVTSGSAVQ